MHKYVLIFILLACALATDYSYAVAKQLRQYSASIEDSAWQVTEKTPLVCQLEHTIPNFGLAVFQSKASKALNLNFELKMLRLPDAYGLAEVLSMPPAWRPGEPGKNLASMALLKQFNGELPKKTAWTLLTELEQGFSPTFYYADWYSPYDQVAARLNPVQFPSGYHAFNECIAALLPYSFEDIAFTVLSYESGSDQLTRESQRRLRQIAAYIQHDPQIETIELQGYTDSYGGRWMNEQLSLKRAEKIKQFLAEAGVADDKVRVDGYGERRHVASNQTTLGRATNRRVVLQMARP
ncbi:OmpA family protein [Arsukibacterium tuosuense]|uniref:OmpA family protein n=1 Tax=Arsukibacterium tuosuense TaxID=1323745 RepID=A0A285J4X0_9GAMM|nr:OmpA family protein [Arsukibacterium tuosuense]SNY55379.1 OmpA family protein [Arsukibacterium tuosuense]